MQPTAWIRRIGLRRRLPPELIAKFAPAPDDAMEPAGSDQILAQVQMTETQHADQPRHQTLASARHVAGARIRTPNMRAERTTQTVRVLVIGELVARDIDCARPHATDRLRARGHHHIARYLAPYERLRQCYSRIVAGCPAP